MYFDILMPMILFLVTLIAVVIGTKSESKLKTIVEHRELKHRDILLIVTLIAFLVSIILFIPDTAIVSIFLFSYSVLLFTVSYAYSSMQLKRVMLYCGVFAIVSIIAAAGSLLVIQNAGLRIYGTTAFIILAFCAFFAFIYAKKKGYQKQKWYLAALSPVLFLLLFLFYSETAFWSPYLLDVYGVIFAMLIIIYLGSMFTWKTVMVFAGFLTCLDIVLVWGTGTMVQSASALSGLKLPVVVEFPTVPWINTNDGIMLMHLGLGDFFFAGILATQTWKKFGNKTAVISLIIMAFSFGLFEIILLNPSFYDAFPIKALPATLPILLGWLPVVIIKTISNLYNQL